MKKDRLLILAFLHIVWKSNTISKLGLYSTKIILSVNMVHCYDTEPPSCHYLSR